MKTLAVCGDSFHAISTSMYKNKSLEGTHYSEILAKKIGLDLINFALGGSSFSLIALQILEAIAIKPDLIIVGPTFPNRVEYTKTVTDNYNFKYETLGNFSYSTRSVPHPYLKLGKSINEYIFVSPVAIVENINFRNEYLNYYPLNIRARFDTMCYMYAIRKLSDSNINYLIWESDNLPNLKSELFNYCNISNIITIEQFDYLKFNDSKNGIPYHTSPEDQVLIAEYLENRIKDQFNVKI